MDFASAISDDLAGILDGEFGEDVFFNGAAEPVRAVVQRIPEDAEVADRPLEGNRILVIGQASDFPAVTYGQVVEIAGISHYVKAISTDERGYLELEVYAA